MAFCQEPRNVTVCDLVGNPTAYAGRIRVRAVVDQGFENFTLDSSECATTLGHVWITYSDDPYLSRELQGKRIGELLPLKHDAAYDDFEGSLLARRLKMPDGQPCGEPCKFFKVTATLTGQFLPASRDPRHFVGYGHMGCCHLLVVEAIEQVDAQRSDVPIGGEFRCSTDRWEFETQGGACRPCASYWDCLAAERETVGRLQRHWGDAFDTHQGSIESLLGVTQLTGPPLFEPGTQFIWTAPDLQTRYTVGALPAAQTKKGQAAPLHVFTVREACVPRSELPSIQRERIACRSVHDASGGSQKEARDIQTQVDQGHSPWMTNDLHTLTRNALLQAVGKANVVLSAGLKLDECDEPGQKTHVSFCTWYSSDGMQYFYVRAQKFSYLKKGWHRWQDVAWIVTGVDGVACQVLAATKPLQGGFPN